MKKTLAILLGTALLLGVAVTPALAKKHKKKHHNKKHPTTQKSDDEKRS